MSETTSVAILSALGGLLTACLVIFGALLARQAARIATLEARDRKAWLYIRSLLDHIYRGRGVPPPTPPEGLFDDD